MSQRSHRKPGFLLKPVVSAIALAIGSSTFADDTAVDLPRVEVSGQEQPSYHIERSANRKFTADLIDTPKSITIISDEVLRDSGSRTLSEALRMTPGITLGAGEGGIAIGDRPFIRGFDTFGSIYVDGVRDLGSQTREVFALEQIEVLKGPSGAFDGRGSPGGSINLVTKQARAGNFISGSAGVGTDSYYRGTFDANTMLGDNAAVRIVGMVNDSDVPGRDNVEMERWGMMPSITLGLNSPTTVSASWYHLQTDDTPDWGLPYRQNPNNPEGSPVGSKDSWYGVKGRDFMETEADILTFNISHDFNDNITLSNTTRYGRTTNEYFVTRPNINDAQLAAGLVNRANSRNRGNRTETVTNLTDLSLAFDTGFVKHNLNTGIEISREESRNRAYSGGAIQPAGERLTPIDNPNNNVGFDPIERNAFPGAEAEATNRSVYVFDTMELSEQWLLNAGIRYDSYDVQLRNRNTGTGAETGRVDNDESFFNYQLGLVYKIQPNLSVYGMYGTATTPTAVNLGEFNYGGSTDDLSPERSRTYEMGAKWNITDGFELSAAVFHIKKTNARVSMLDGDFDNIGEAEVNGFEIGFSGNLTDRWSVFGGYTYLDAEQTKAGTGSDSNQIGAADAEGKQLWNTPEHSASLWTTYDLLDQLTVGGGMFYMDKVYADPSNNGFIPSYVRWDAMAKYDLTENLDLQLNVLNLTDERYFASTYFRHFAVPGPGRSAMLTLNFNY